MICNANITIVNRKRDSERHEVLMPTIIKDVAWHSDCSATGGNSVSSHDTLKVRIPIDADFGEKTYVPRVVYDAMPIEEAKEHWTLAERDIIVRGEVTEGDVTQTKLAEQFPELFLINSYSDNTDLGTDTVKHWRVGGA